jgi:Uncharacterized protein conserved in bacteria
MAIRFAKPATKPTVRIDRTIAAKKPKHAGGRPKTGNPKVVLNIRVDPAVLSKFKATGAGWQKLVNDILAAAKV